MDKTADIHLTLPSELLISLDQVAEERGLRRVALLRTVIEDFVKLMVARRIEHEIDEYVDELGVVSREFVGETEGHTLERLLRETEW